ncbi:MAG: CPBP family intramembrane metalloprotease [Planctomycetes bacterium]|nr:CPBP family intramembrane metalloprotease [Planctomycetota bacterium]MBL7008542.1 CPBP family intramembrane metalloprotease [Planctomycetota bacterium]
MTALRRWRMVGDPAQDPATTFLLLLPLGLLHISGWRQAGSGAFGFVLRLLRWLGPAAPWILATGLLLLLLWAIGRIRSLRIPWRTSAAAVVVEGLVLGFLLGPLLSLLTSLTPIESAPLAWSVLAEQWHAKLALSAGAGLYEEVLFRAGLLAGCRLLLLSFFRGLGWHGAAPVLALGLSLFLSSAAFAFAHAWGHPEGVAIPELTFLFLAGVLLGLIWRWRGLAVVAYTHAAYDAFLLL